MKPVNISVLGTSLKAHVEFLLMASHYLEGCIGGTGKNYPSVLLKFFWTSLSVPVNKTRQFASLHNST